MTTFEIRKAYQNDDKSFRVVDTPMNCTVMGAVYPDLLEGLKLVILEIEGAKPLGVLDSGYFCISVKETEPVRPFSPFSALVNQTQYLFVGKMTHLSHPAPNYWTMMCEQHERLVLTPDVGIQRYSHRLDLDPNGDDLEIYIDEFRKLKIDRKQRERFWD